MVSVAGSLKSFCPLLSFCTFVPELFLCRVMLFKSNFVMLRSILVFICEDSNSTTVYFEQTFDGVFGVEFVSNVYFS